MRWLLTIMLSTQCLTHCLTLTAEDQEKLQVQNSMEAGALTVASAFGQFCPRGCFSAFPTPRWPWILNLTPKGPPEISRRIFWANKNFLKKNFQQLIFRKWKEILKNFLVSFHFSSSMMILITFNIPISFVHYSISGSWTKLSKSRRNYYSNESRRNC